MNRPTLTQIQFNHQKHFGSLSSLSPVKSSNLEPYQLAFISNGCGPRGWGAVPDLSFTQSCDEHDFAYWKGGTAAEREEADESLLYQMLWCARGYRNPFRRWFRYGVAWAYYAGVRLVGWDYWERTPANARLLLSETLDQYGYGEEDCEIYLIEEMIKRGRK